MRKHEASKTSSNAVSDFDNSEIIDLINVINKYIYIYMSRLYVSLILTAILRYSSLVLMLDKLSKIPSNNAFFKLNSCKRAVTHLYIYFIKRVTEKPKSYRIPTVIV